MIPEWLRDILRAHPAYREEDVLKTVFQALYGNGHLLADAAAVQMRITTEMADGGPDRGEPLTETMDSWLRLNLRPAREAGLAPEWIAEMIRASGYPCVRDRRAVAAAIAGCGPIPGMDMDRLSDLTETLVSRPGTLPSHSGAVHRLEDPRYRLMDAAWEPLLPIFQAVAQLPDDQPQLITIDGRCGSGKSTLAEALRLVLGCPVVHTDDFVIPHGMKTAERLALPGGNEDVDRLLAEALIPFQLGAELRPRRYICSDDRFEEAERIPAGRLLILEGSYSGLPPIAERAGLRVFLRISAEDQWRRLEKRNSPDALRGFRDRWIPLEEAYLSACGLPDRGCVCLDAMSLRLERVLRHSESR